MIDKSFINMLKVIKSMKKGDFEKLVDFLNDESIDHICECVFNIINTDLKMTKKKLSCLKRHVHRNCSVKRLQTISNKNIPILKRRQAIKQEGKGLPMLLASVIPFLADIFLK